MISSSQTWSSLKITVESTATEAIESALNQAGAIGTEINLSVMLHPGDETIVIGYFNERPDAETLKSELRDGLRIYGFDENALKSVEWNQVENRDWLAEWKKHWKPTEVGKFTIAPPWESVQETDKIVVRIDPNMAFGTGTHETTRLCLEAVSDLYRPGQSFLDVGTGTGILAIAAAKLATAGTRKFQDRPQPSVEKIVACDTDPNSVRIGEENAVANGVGEQIEFSEGSIDHETPVFDFICANLTIDVIVPILPMLIQKTRSVLVLSGILLEQKESISSELEKSQVSNFKFEILGEWISVTVTR